MKTFKKSIALSLLCSSISLALTVSLMPTVSAQVTPDTTKTNTNVGAVDNNGYVNVTTGTVKGNVGFNAFTKLNIGSTDKVNLHLPANTNTLVNMVYDSKATNINGFLQSIKNGVEGAGNIYLVNPMGLTVGESGSINVGSLSVIAPNQSFMDNFFTEYNNPDQSLVDQLLGGNVETNPDSEFRNNGVITAANNINIQTSKIFNGYQINAGDVVNLDALGLITLDGDNSKIVSTNGSIEIVAGNVIIQNTISNNVIDAANGSVKIASKSNNVEIIPENTWPTDLSSLGLDQSEINRINTPILEIAGNEVNVQTSVTRDGNLKLKGSTVSLADNAIVSATESVSLVTDNIVLGVDASIDTPNTKIGKLTEGNIAVIDPVNPESLNLHITPDTLSKLVSQNIHLGNSATTESQTQDVRIRTNYNNSNGSITINAADDAIVAAGITLEAKGDIVMTANDYVVNRHDSIVKSNEGSINLTSNNNNVAVGYSSTLNAANDINLNAANNSIIRRFSNAVAGNDINLNAANNSIIRRFSNAVAGNDVNINAGKYSFIRHDSSIKAGNNITSTSGDSSILGYSAILNAGNNVKINSGNNIILRANSEIDSGIDIDLNAVNDIIIRSGVLLNAVEDINIIGDHEIISRFAELDAGGDINID